MAKNKNNSFGSSKNATTSSSKNTTSSSSKNGMGNAKNSHAQVPDSGPSRSGPGGE